jgi:transcriptional regulator with XRE-family HTH domain
MVTRGSVRRKSKETFQKVIKLRKRGLSYTEIKKETGIAKSTINNWLSFAGLTLSKEHLEIQNKKRVENHILGTIASKVTRVKRKTEDIDNFIQKHRSNLNDPLFNYCIALFEAEGSKSTDCKFSNSDYKLIKIFVLFSERYLQLDRIKNINYSLYIHETRRFDLEKILYFWANKLRVRKDKIRVYWKKNKVTHRKENQDYTGQMNLRIKGEKVLGSKLLAISDIILKKSLK